MERIASYRLVLEQSVARLAASPPGHGAIETLALCDREQDQYQVLQFGWDGDRRIFTVLVHAHLRAGRIWIERDGTAEGLAAQLVAAGVPAEAIVLAFYPAWKRAFTDFAAVS
jgi:hypothetical protein